MKKRLLALVTGYAFAQYQVLKTFKRYDPVRKTMVLDIPHTNVTFKSNDLNLHGNLFGENKKGLIIFSHGLGLNSDDYFGITKGFVENGYQVLAYDNTGTYRSDGINTVGINQSLVDLRSALDWVMANDDIDKSNLFLCGHSWGGYAVCAILSEHKKYPIKGVISLAGSDNATNLLVENSKDVFNGFGVAFVPMTMAYHLVTFKKDFLKTSVRGLNKSKIPALIVHGTDDDQIPIDTTSIVAKKNKIRNENVEFFIRQQKGHNEIFESEQNPKEVDPVLLERMVNFLENI